MSPSPLFPSPLPPSHSPSGRPGIIGEHRVSNIPQQHHQLQQQQPHQQNQHAGEPPNGEYLLHLLQAGHQHVLQQQQPHSSVVNGGGGAAGGGGGEGGGVVGGYGFAMPGIVSGGGDIPMATWDPAVAAMGPSHSYAHSHNGIGIAMMSGGVMTSDGRDFLYSSPHIQHNVPMGSGWPPHRPPPQPQAPLHPHPHSHPHPFASSPSAASASASSSPPVDLRQLHGRTGNGHTSIPSPATLYGGHVDMLQRRSAEWHPTLQKQPQQQNLLGMPTETELYSNFAGNAQATQYHSQARGSSPAHRGPHQQFFGDGAELMKLLQISSSPSSSAGSATGPVASVPADSKAAMDGRQTMSSGGSGSGLASSSKVSPTIAHGPIGPPKRHESSSSSMSSPAEDLLGRFWPAPAAPPISSNGSQEDQNTKPPGFSFKENPNPPNLGTKDIRSRWVEEPPPPGMVLMSGESALLPAFGNRDGVGPRYIPPNRLFSASKGSGGRGAGGGRLPDGLEFHNGRGLLGGWGGDYLDDLGMVGGGGAGGESGLQYRKGGIGGRSREEIFGKSIDRQTANLMALHPEQQLLLHHHHQPQQLLLHGDGQSASKDLEAEHSRDSNGRVMEGTMRAVGSLRRGGAANMNSRGGEMGVTRRGGRSVIGQWVAVNERQKEREALEMAGHGPIGDGGGAESGSDKGSSSNSTSNSLKEEVISLSSREGSSASQKSARDLDPKRRRGQQQEWRMKTPNQAQIQIHGQVQTSPPVGALSTPKAADLSPGSGSGSGSGFSSESLEPINGNHHRLLSPLKIRPLAAQVDHPGLPSNVVQRESGTPGSATEEAKKLYHDRAAANGGTDERTVEEGGEMDDEDEIGDILVTHIEVEDDPDVRSGHSQDVGSTSTQEEHGREFRRHTTYRTPVVPTLKPDMKYRPDLEKFTAQMLSIYVSLIPTEEEENTRRQFLSHLDQLVAREWPGAMLFLFGSCANAFGVCNSDIDVCLSISDDQLSKADLVLKMAAILRTNNMQNVQALTHARVPIVKFSDPSTDICCDICVNNMLAVVNSKLLHDYSQIDVRLRQLAFLVKHWARRRKVNETYRGTLSSYAYVLMCIHFLQQRKPPILPCLQEMPPTYKVTVSNIDCAYYDQVLTLQSFGAGNKETVGELLTSFFEYWAFRHDYNRAVVSVRKGGYLSKDEKEWTRRIGNERHLICIEDPLETTHDLGRVVDRQSIRVLRDEFHRAAKILRHDLNPCTTLFESFIREKPMPLDL